MSKRLKRAAAAALVLLAVSPGANAAGLGQLTVLSALGQPFRAEVNLVALKKDELSSLNARLANPDAFRQADLPYTAYVSNLKVSIEKRPNGEPYLRISSSQPLNEPFIDFLVELYSGTGRIVRAYTALVDPPTIPEAKTAAPEAGTAPAAPAQGAQVKPLEPPPVVQGTPAPGQVPPGSVTMPETGTTAQSAPVQPEPMPLQHEIKPEAPAAPPPEPQGMKPEAPATTAAAPAPAEAAPAEYGPVQYGDTLSKIARANMSADVTLDQMLVLLYRNNPDAFAGKNMNRLRTGKVLRLPEPSEYGTVTPEVAHKEVRVQAANWRAYRERLAAAASGGAATTEEPAGPTASGKVSTTVAESGPAADESSKDVLRLSKAEPPGSGQAGAGAAEGSAQDRIRSLEEELAAKGKAVADANDRIAKLEKQIKDMQSLLAMKSKGMSEVQNSAGSAGGEGTGTKAVTEPEPPVAPPVAGTPGEAGSHATGEAPVAEGPQPMAPATSEPPAAQPAEPAPPPKPKRKLVQPPPPSLVDDLMGNPLVLGAGALIVAALGALGFMTWKRKAGAKGAGSKGGAGAVNEAPPIGGSEDTFGPAGFAAAAGAAAGAATAESSVAPATGGGDESDALAEAEVFLIYGRDAQAEERLKEAIAVTPERYELHAKLLEIYAKRGDVEAFESVAQQLQMGTGGQGELWEKAVRLGYELDPTNPRYADGRMEDVGEDRTMPGADEEATVQMPAFESNPRDDLDFNLDFDSGPSGSGSSTDLDLNQLGDELASSSTTTTDIDLGLLGDAAEGDEVFDPTQTMRTEVKSGDEGAQETSEMEAFDPTAALAPPDTGDLPTLPGIGMADEGKKAADEGLDFELGGDDTTSGEGVSGTIDDVGFDLDTLKLDSPPLGDTGDGHEESSAGAAAGAGTGELAVPDFDLSTDLEADATRPGTGTSTDLDLSTISLELGDDDSPTIVPTGNKDEKWYDVQTKFDLAKAYQEMGDKEGAREILEEVIAEGDDEQKGAAQGLLAELG